MTAMIALLVTLFLTPTSATARDESTLVNEVAALTVKYDHGAVHILRVERQTLPSPERMRRWRGRFEARALGGGGKVLDLVRFDFPLMAAAESPDDTTADAKQLGQKLREHVTATAIVRAPLPAGATAVAVYDSVTRKSVSADLPSRATPASRASPASPPPPAAAGGGNTKR